MFKVDIENKRLVKILVTSFSALNLKERFDIQEWIDGTPEILGEDLLVIAKELILPSSRRLDLLAVDKEGALVIIELKRDDSGSDVEWQAIKYASYCSSFSQDEIYKYFAEYLGTDIDDAQVKIEEFIDCEPENLNEKQRIILVSKEFNSEVISAVLWLRDALIDIECLRITPHVDQQRNIFINADIIIPLPEARDYIQKKEVKVKEQKIPGKSSFSLEASDLSEDQLKEKIFHTLIRPSDLTPRFRAFLEIIISEDRVYDREEVKQGLVEAGISNDIGQAGRYLSNISQFLTKKSNPHLRQAIAFKTSGAHGETKDNYRVISEYRGLIQQALEETNGEMPEDIQDNQHIEADAAQAPLNSS
ncbi:MAG: MmcB family DNA repair protein [Candidatus Omnitrophota bacterium]